MCANNRPPTPVLKELNWTIKSEDNWNAPDSLILQTSCCYEGWNQQHLFNENRRSLFSVLEKVKKIFILLFLAITRNFGGNYKYP